jgi:signal transduction histidine kinase
LTLERHRCSAYGVRRPVRRRLASRSRGCWPPARRRGDDGQLLAVGPRRSVKLDAGQEQEIDRLRVEIEELHAAQERLVLAADADRRKIERDLHDGVHQHLVALATTLQLARLATDFDAAAVKGLFEEMSRDVRQALDETALLAQSIYPSTLELGGLAALLRAAAVNADVPATVDVTDGSSPAPEVAMTVYLCWLAVLARGSKGSRVTITVREAGDTLTFELVGKGTESEAKLDRLQDRVEALGGRLTIEPDPGGCIRLSGSLPLRR